VSVLCIDCGNTRLKWGLRDGGAWLAQGALPLTRLDELTAGAERILACNVAGARGREAIEAFSARRGVAVEWLRSRAAQCGISNGYQHPEQLGADRWAALIGARHLYAGACLVVNSGTATTVDVLTADGCFRGGLILPGLAMMRGSLAANTADLPAGAGEMRELPTNTFDAIASGCLHATAGAIERMFRQIAAAPGACCLLSGGAAPAIAQYLTLPLRVIDNLVLEGLARVAGEAASLG
jgi:type III pantothenate kinase